MLYRILFIFPDVMKERKKGKYIFLTLSVRKVLYEKEKQSYMLEMIRKR